MNILLRRNKETLIDVLTDMLQQISIEEHEEEEHLKKVSYWRGTRKEALDKRIEQRQVDKQAIYIVLDKIKNPVPSMTTTQYLNNILENKESKS